MAVLDVTPQSPPGKYPATPLVADSADLEWTAAGEDFAEGARFPCTSRELLLVRNDNAGAQTVTITSEADEKNRLGDIEDYSVGIGEYAMFGPFPRDGWADSGGYLNFEASAADMYFAVIRLPALV